MMSNIAETAAARSDDGGPLDASIILCVRDGAATIREQLDALAHQRTSISWELIVVDNGSTDPTTAVVEEWMDEHRSIRARLADASTADGLAAARNVGAAAARGLALAFCDADDVADEGWLDALARALGDADLVGGPLELTRLNPPGVRVWQERIRPQFIHGLPGGSSMPFVVGANFAVSTAAYFAVGGCDEELRGAWEDVDLSLRIKAAGGRIGYVPTAVMHYRLRQRLPDVLRQQRHYGRGEASLRRKIRASGTIEPIQWRKIVRVVLKAPLLMTLPKPQRREWAQQFAYYYGLVSGLVMR
jgi:glycosyltransferase involved in cell wall biosynthesis